jgi:hypothetical protein
MTEMIGEWTQALMRLGMPVAFVNPADLISFRLRVNNKRVLKYST